MISYKPVVGFVQFVIKDLITRLKTENIKTGMILGIDQ